MSAQTLRGGAVDAGLPRTTLRIAHLFPELLNLYGDGGNIITLRKRCVWRGIDVEVLPVHFGERPSCDQLHAVGDELRSYVADDGVLLAVCGGYQLLGHSYLMGDEKVEGLSLVDLYTDRGTPRLIGNVMIESELQDRPIVGYENHGGRTHLGAGVQPLGRVLKGFGNDGASGQEGCLWRNVVGTYIHGPLLPKNPGVADWLIARALERRLGTAVTLPTLDDEAELAANDVMCERLRRNEA